MFRLSTEHRGCENTPARSEAALERGWRRTRAAVVERGVFSRPLGALVIALLATGPASALDRDREQPIHIEADSVTIDDQKKVSHYRGAVRMSQGSIQATGDEITVYSDESGPQRIITTGAPATFRQRPEGKDQDAYGQAQRIEHDTEREITLFAGEARFFQGQEEFTGQRIEYDAGRDQVRAQGGSDGNGRVRIVIQPKGKSDAPAPKAAQ